MYRVARGLPNFEVPFSGARIALFGGLYGVPSLRKLHFSMCVYIYIYISVCRHGRHYPNHKILRIG